MSTEPRVLIGASQLGWVTSLTQWVSDHGGARLVGQVLTMSDIDPAAFDVLVVDAASSLLSRRLVDRVEAAGAAVIVLVHPLSSEHESSRLHDLGVSLYLPVSTTPEDIIGRAREVAATRRARIAAVTDPPDGAAQRPSNQLIAVLGDGGATELSVNLAVISARAGKATALIDLDTVEPKLAQRLGLSQTPNVFDAVEQLRNGRFHPTGVSESAGLTVIPGLANPRQWDELTSVDADELVAGLGQRFSPVMAVIHPNLENLAPLSGLQGRFDVGRRIVELADWVLVVANGSPMGAVRSLMLVADIRSLTQAPIHVAVNRMLSSAFMRAEWEKEFVRSFTPASITFLPFDRRVPLAAWNGQVPARGPFLKAVRRLAAILLEDSAA